MDQSQGNGDKTDLMGVKSAIKPDIERYFDYLDVSGYARTTKYLYSLYAHYLNDQINETSVTQFLKRFPYGNARAFLKSFIINFMGLKDFDIPKMRGRKGQEIHQFLTRAEVDKLIDMAQDTEIKAFISLAFEGGLRRAELMNIKADDIDFERRAITGRGKGDKPFEVRFTQKTALLLHKLTQEAGSHGESLVFQHGKTYYYDRLKALFNSMGKKVRQPVHIFRHSAGFFLRQEWKDLEKVRQYLRLTNLNTVKIYARATLEEVGKSWDETFDK